MVDVNSLSLVAKSNDRRPFVSIVVLLVSSELNCDFDADSSMLALRCPVCSAAGHRSNEPKR